MAISAWPPKYVLGGWAFFLDDEVKRRVEIESNSSLGDRYTRVRRGDCDPDVSIGFEIDVTTGDLAKLLAAEFRVDATYQDAKKRLEVWGPCHDRIRRIVLDELLLSGAETAFLEYAASAVLRAADVQPATGGFDWVSESSVSVGGLSLAGDVIVGSDGSLFLYKGSNAVHQQYSRSDGCDVLASQWEALIRERVSSCRGISADFVQLIIPEKQSVVHGGFPGSPDRNTPLFDSIQARVASVTGILDVNSEFARLQKDGRPPFRKVDSHLSIHGLTAILSMICRQVGYVPAFDPDEVEVTRMGGDLGIKFFRGGSFSEDVASPRAGYLVGTCSPTLVTAKDVTGHIGLERVRENAQAPIKRSVTVFGNSFFERGIGPLSLSYWVARLFSRVHFIWTPSFDASVVRQDMSDLVICQTVERFLVHVPSDNNSDH